MSIVKTKCGAQTPNFQKTVIVCIKYTYHIVCYEVLMYIHFLPKVLTYNWRSVSILMQTVKGKSLNFNAAQEAICVQTYNYKYLTLMPY